MKNLSFVLLMGALIVTQTTYAARCSALCVSLNHTPQYSIVNSITQLNTYAENEGQAWAKMDRLCRGGELYQTNGLVLGNLNLNGYQFQYTAVGSRFANILEDCRR